VIASRRLSSRHFVAQSVALQPDCEILVHELETSIEILVQP
jgi:hypothetical protein